MDGLTITCRTCAVRISIQDAEDHVCRPRPLQQYTNASGYNNHSQRRPNEPPTSQRSLSNGSSMLPNPLTDFKAEINFPLHDHFKNITSPSKRYGKTLLWARSLN